MATTRNLSKSKLLAFRQCPKRLWLEIHHPELREDSAATQASFDVGHQVGEIARRLYDPKGVGTVIVPERGKFAEALKLSAELLATPKPIFEAGFAAGGALAFADVLLPRTKQGKRVWRMVEVKSSASVKDYHRDDIAIQAFVARTAGVPLASIALAHIDSAWVYPGGEDYQGLLTESELTDEAFPRTEEVKGWIGDAQVVARKKKEPAIGTGRHCSDPYECGFLAYCQGQEAQPKYPAAWLPRVQTKTLKAFLEDEGVADLRHVPDELLNPIQLRVKTHTLNGKTYFDHTGAKADLAAHKLPAYFLDFETIQFAIPIWKGNRPYQQIPFQFSLHRLSRTGKLEQRMFLDLSGKDPSAAFAAALVNECGTAGPIFVYNAGFEMSRIRELATRFPKLKQSLLAINARVVDLRPVAEQRFYHPSQEGSWGLKSVLPAIAHLNYDDLDGVQDGGMAMSAYLEAIAPSTTKSRKDEVDAQLRSYCSLDTLALVQLWQFFAGRTDLKL